MRILHGIAEALVWIAAVALLLLPAVVAIDRGGVLHWTQYAICWAVLPIAGLSLLAFVNAHDRVPPGALAIVAPLGSIAAWAWFQTVGLPPGIDAILAGGTLTVIDDWLIPIVGVEAATAARRSISISPVDTGHAAAMLTLLVPVGLAASLAMRTRARLTMLLMGLALFGASVAVLGIYRQSSPDGWQYLMDTPYPFGGFVNRNNAGLALNIGLAASLGILAWRMVAIHEVELDDPQNDWGDLLGLIHDQTSMLAAICGSACIAGLLISGSRGGLVGALAGVLIAAGYIRTRRGLMIAPVLFLFFAAAAALLFAPIELPWLSVERLGDSDPGLATLINDGRWSHWHDGWAAGLAHLPAGSGISTYSYAYLPHQDHSMTGWFQHADNLWLEIFVETGLVGILLTVATMGLWAWSLHRLVDSPDPIDQGIRVAGWFSLASLGVTQAFDFGLILPANAVAVVVLASAAISRACSTSIHRTTDSNVPRPRLRLQSDRGRWRRRVALATIAAGTLAAGGAATWRLRQDAQAEYAFTLIRAVGPRVRFDDEKLQRLNQPAIASLARRSYPAVARWLSESRIDRGRLLETLETSPATVAQFEERYGQLVPGETTRPYRGAELPDSPETSRAVYAAATDSAVAGLCACPLDPRPRDLLIALHRTNSAAGRPGECRRTARCRGMHCSIGEILQQRSQAAASTR